MAGIAAESQPRGDIEELFFGQLFFPLILFCLFPLLVRLLFGLGLFVVPLAIVGFVGFVIVISFIIGRVLFVPARGSTELAEV